MAQYSKRSTRVCKKCDQCQRFTLNIHQLEGVLNPLSSPWSFAQWGLDIVGPFPKAVGNRRWLLVGIDYFTEWVEAKPLSNIRDLDAKKFVEKHCYSVWALEIDIQLQLIHKEIGRLRQLTKL